MPEIEEGNLTFGAKTFATRLYFLSFFSGEAEFNVRRPEVLKTVRLKESSRFLIANKRGNTAEPRARFMKNPPEIGPKYPISEEIVYFEPLRWGPFDLQGNRAVFNYNEIQAKTLLTCKGKRRLVSSENNPITQ